MIEIIQVSLHVRHGQCFSLLYPHFPSNGSPVVTYDQTSSTYFSGVSFFVYQTVQKYTPSNKISDKHTRTSPTVL